MNPKLFWLITAIFLVQIYPGHAQQSARVPRIGYLTSPSFIKSRIEAFRQGLRDLNYIEGKSIIIERRSADGVDERLPNLASELVRLKPDVIVTSGTPSTQAAKDSTKTIPIVMTSVSDPLGTGLVASLGRPGGNVTGITNFQSDLGGKQLELLKEVVPNVSVVTVLWDPANPGNITWAQDMKAVATGLRIALQDAKVHGASELETTLETIKKGQVKALIVLGNAATNSHQAEVVNFAMENRLASMYGDSALVEIGGLVSYGPSRADLLRRTAVYVDKILKGAKPADLPVEQPNKIELIINLKTAKQIGLIIPPNVLARADRVIK